MEQQNKPDAKLRAMFWTSELWVREREWANDRKVERLVMDIQRQNGLPCEPRGIAIFDTPNLTGAMMKLMEGFREALYWKLNGTPPPPFPSGLLPLLVERVPENRFPAVLAALRGAAQRLHEEDDTPVMHVTRFFARLRDGASP